MKRCLLCLLLIFSAALCFARGKQDIIVSENYSSEIKNVVVTISNKTEADFQTLVMTRKEVLSEKWELTDRRTFTVRSGESKSVVLDNQGLYKLELYDAKGHKFSKKNTYSQIIKDKNGNIISEGEYQQFTQPWQKLVFTEQDFEPQAALDVVEVFFGIYGNEKHEQAPEKTCSVIIVNDSGEQIEYLSVVQDGNARASNLAIGKGQCGVLDIKQSDVADISLITRSQHVYTKTGLVFDEENLTVIFTPTDRVVDAEKAAGFVSTALGSITNALSITTQAFSSVIDRITGSDEFEPADASAELEEPAETADAGTTAAGDGTPSTSGADLQPAAEETSKKSFWSWLPWVD